MEDFRDARVLVTGGRGFLGRNLCARLRAQGSEPIRLSRSDEGLDEQARWVFCDLAYRERLARLFQRLRPDLVFHLAGATSGDRSRAGVERAVDVNAFGTSNLLLAVADSCPSARVVIAGTLESSNPWLGPTQFATPYGASKIMAEVMAGMMRDLHGLAVVSARIGMSYGPDDPNAHRFVPHVIKSLLEGVSPALSNAVRPEDWIHVDDVVDALLAMAAARKTLPYALDVGTGIKTPGRDVANRIREHLGTDVPLGFGELEDRPGEPFDADVAAMRAHLGWKARIVLEQGLRDTVAWYRERHHASLAAAR